MFNFSKSNINSKIILPMMMIIIMIVGLLDASSCYASGYTYLSGLAHGLNIPEHVLTYALLAVMFSMLGLAYRVKVGREADLVIPDSKLSLRSVMEAYGDFIFKQCKSVIGEEYGIKYFPFMAFIFLFILLNNLLGLIPGFLPPTENLNTTLALGLLSFIYYNIQGCKEQGIIGHIKHFMGPLWYMAVLIFPIEIISKMVRPVSLALRLRGNMFGDHIVLGIFSNLIPIFVPIVFMLLGILVSIIQAFVFTILSMVYVSLAVAHQDHGDDHH